MAVQVRCGICQEIFSIETWAKECDCTFCGAHRTWTTPSTFAWTAAGSEAAASAPRRTLLGFGRRLEPANAVGR